MDISKSYESNDKVVEKDHIIKRDNKSKKSYKNNKKLKMIDESASR